MKFLYIHLFIFFIISNLPAKTTLDTVPTTQKIGHMSTTWDDFTTVSPSEQIPLIQAPNASITGNANLNFPIKLPDARHGHQPDLNITYNNEGGSTWLGIGWDLSISSFTLDTRWGVPTFDPTTESEIYLLDGQQMGPVFHRITRYEREPERQFHLRQEGTFQKIIRHGDSPKNYWWEVRQKDGIIKHYGGTPSTGRLTDYTISTSNGNITEWLLVESIDIYDNLIKYQYQKSSFRSGTEVYPLTITYNGKNQVEGNYKIDFQLGGVTDQGERKDATLECRSGMIRSISQLLKTITVRYKEKTIRTYDLQYKEGQFHKTLLTAVSESDENGDLFYTYVFNYFDSIARDGNVLDLWGNVEEWTVPKDNIDVNAVSATNVADFLESPTILGGAKSWNISGGLAVTVGFVVGNPATKENTVGANGGGGTSNGTGIISLVDINGDGLPDKVWKEDDKLYYRANQMISDGIPEFGEKVELTGVTDFSKSNTISWNIGGELTAGVSEASVFVGYSYEENNTKITTYFADFNGDDLIDIASNQKVFFNSIGSDGHPRFTESSGDTPSPIFKSNVEPPVIFDPEEQQAVENASPLHDAVRVWRAPIDGSINITGSVRLLEDEDPATQNLINKDGVITMIQHNEDELWRQVINADDFVSKEPTGVSSVMVERGDTIFFRVHSRYNGNADHVEWNPQVQYLNQEIEDRDANGLSHYQYQASKEFLLSNAVSYPLSEDGLVEIQAKVSKPELTDSIFIRFRGGIVLDTAFGPSEIINEMITLSNIPVLSGTDFSVSVYAKTNVDWAKIDFRPMVTYTSYADGSPAINSDGTPLNVICPVADFQSFNNVTAFGDPYIVPQDGTVTVTADLNFFLASDRSAHFSLKSKMHPDSIRTVDTLVSPSISEMQLTMNVLEGDTLFADMHYMNMPIGNITNVQVSKCEFVMDSDTTEVECGVYYRNQATEISGHLYRGWGQFAYNANDGRGDMAIIVGDLEVDEDAVAGDTTLIDEGADPGTVEGTTVTLDDLFVVMSADPKSKAWRGSDAHTFVASSIIASSRNGNQDVDLSSNTTNIGDAFPAPELKTKSFSNAVAGEVGPVGGGLTFATSFSKMDITDMNGDRYPDYVYENSIQYTNQSGGLSERVFNHNWGTHEADSQAEGISVGGSFVGSSAKNTGASLGKGSNKKTTKKRSQGKSKLSGARNAFNASGTAIGLSGSLTFDSDWTKHTFIDLNGDGLEDKVWEDGMVALNLGYSFASPQDWGFSGIQEGDAKDIGGGVGINYVSGSIMAGLSASRTDNHSTLGFIDLNDDALVDRVISTKPMVVQMNTGSGFGAPVTLNESSEMDEGFSIGESTNLAGTVCIPFFFIRICFNPSTSIGHGTSSVGHAFDDVNGDGYIDVLSAHGDDGHLSVRTSNIGPVNMLQSIQMPMNGEMSFTYEPLGNTLQMPYSKWVLSGYSVNDGVEGDGESTYSYEFEYKHPKHDRHERQFYGFETVQQIQRWPQDESKNRTIETSYYVDNLYSQGLIRELSILSNNDTVFQKTEYRYTLRDINSGIALPPSFVNRDDVAAWPSLDQKKIIMTEGSELTLTRIYEYVYDSIGNELMITDTDQAGSIQETNRTYYYDDQRYFMNQVKSESIYGNGDLYRQTEYIRDDKGNLIQLREQLDGQSFVETDMTYDDFGNILTLSKPENYNGERLTFERKYDGEEFQYMIYEKDGYGYEEHFDYEYLYNQLLSSIDINGNPTRYTLDSKGRIKSISYPYEIEAGLPYSIRFDYFPNASYAHAISYHYDPAHNSDLDVIVFEDGLQREIQTKVRAAIASNGQDLDRYIVSGWEEYDIFGRKTKSYLPIIEPTANRSSLNLNRDASFSITIYDVFDRPTEVLDPYDAKTSYEYTLDYSNNGELALTTRTTDPLGYQQYDYFNTRGKIIAERFDGPNDDIWQSYVYDGYSQVKNIYDAFGNETSYTYDMLGRRISVKVPDAGITELKYDKANNLIERITATIRDKISEDGSIRYQYDKERLVQIDYPKHFQNKVQIHYGAPQDSFNRAGRIWLQEDATGGREYFFDSKGNPTKTIRTVMINRSKVFTYVSEAEYDTWGRVTKYSYPDGESLLYTYNQGGQLQQMIGIKGEHITPYLTYAGYDKFTDRVYMEYGNGTTDNYFYDNKGRLVNRITNTSNATSLLDETYSYDKADNLVSRITTGQIDQTIGGNLRETYKYDVLHRLIHANGTWTGSDSMQTYDLTFGYDALNNLTLKDQFVHINDEVDILASRVFDYTYEHENQPTRPSEVGGKQFSYDPNGNLLLSSSQSIFNYDQNVFDEENRLQGTSNNGYISRYTYDAFGVRTLKSHGEFQGVFINGAPAGFLEHKVNFRVDVSPYFTVFENDYRKHYFVDDLRILSKIGTGVFQTALAQGPEITAGGIDFKSRIQQYEQSILNYYAELGVPPGPPTLLALLGQPEINDVTLPNATNANPYNTPPTNWPSIPSPDSTGPPGVPVFFDFAYTDNTNVSAGYNFTSGGIVPEVEQFYFHYDNSGSTAYITDLAGNARQHSAYLPSGERWVDKATTRDKSSYMHSGLLLDEETGMYDLGNIYYDPVTNIEQSVDPILQNFGESTFKNRPEGNFYYDYAKVERDDDPVFDNEILNSERPDPFLSNASAEPIEADGEEKPLLTYKMVKEAITGQELGWDISKIKIDDDHPFAKEITQLVPYLAARNDLDNPKVFKQIVKEVIVIPERRKQIKEFKKFFRTKVRRKKERKVRKVRF
ncbi:MAG: SpvB/TcaC N-terminal domain-containing protein [Bacteroidota bacterium]